MMEFYGKPLDYEIPAEKRNDDDFCAIDADTAVGMVEHGFSVYMDGTDRQITYEQLFITFSVTDLEQHSFFAPRSEFEQNRELETLTDDIDRLNDEVLSKDPTYSIDDYAKDLNNMGDSSYRWRDGRSEWENICDSILSGKTEYIPIWLNDISDNFEVGQIAERLKGYEGKYQRDFPKDERAQQFQSEKNLAEKQDISYNINADLSATRGESRGNTMENTTDFMPIGKVTPEFLEDFAVHNDCLFEVGAGAPECHIRYGYDPDKKTIRFGTPNADVDAKDTLIISGDIYRLLGGNLGENLYKDLGEELHRNERFDILSSEREKYKTQQLQSEKNLAEKQDISHNINADLSATRGESRGNSMAEHSTKMEVSSMVNLEGNGAKAVATVVINDEFALKGIKVYEGENGLFVSMPSRKMGGEYTDVIFPITAEAREQLHNAVLERYEDMAAKGIEKFQAEKKAPPEKSTSDITVTMHRVNDEHTKAAGQIVIDNCIVVSGVKVKHGANVEGIEKDFVSMPQYQTQTGEYNQYANPITKDCYEKINSAVLGAYEKLEKTEYRGARFSELGEKTEVSTQYGLNPKYAEKVMDALDKQGIKYFSKSYEGKTSISVNNADRQALDKTQKEVTASLKQAKEKTTDKPEHKPKGKTH